MMKRLTLAACAAMLAVPGVAMAQDGVPTVPSAAARPEPAKMALAHQVIDIMFPPERREKMFEDILTSFSNSMVTAMLKGSDLGDQLKRNPKAARIFDAFMKRQRELGMQDLRTAMPQLMDAYAQAYARIFTTEDLNGILVFAKSRAGTHFLQRSANLMNDPAVLKWQNALTSRTAERNKRELRQFKKDIDAAFADDKSGT